jgi:flavin reductase (DIM6/NTAB) family NADH-FMN oxidoreductase RutF
MFYATRSNGHGLPHDPFKAIVAPRPIGWISTRSLTGEVNLAPYSFFNALSTKPYLVMFSSEGFKDSVAFASESGEFAVNLVTAKLMQQMNETSAPAPRGVNEFGIAGLAMADCHLITAPRVAEAAANLECKVTDILRPRGADGAESGVHVVLGEVVGIHIDDNCLTDGLFDVTKARPVARLGYMDYCEVTEVFSLQRPSWKPS